MQAMEAVTTMTTLKKVALARCECLTDASIEKLGLLEGLQELSLIECSGITEKGMNFLRRLTELDSLTVHKCPQVRLSQQSNWVGLHYSI